MDETRVDILDAASGVIMDHCNGPTPGGSCPYAERDATVPCNRRRIAPMGSGPEWWLVYVPRCRRSGSRRTTALDRHAGGVAGQMKGDPGQGLSSFSSASSR